MMNMGFVTKYKISIKVPKTPPSWSTQERHPSHPLYEYPGSRETLGMDRNTENPRVRSEDLRMSIACGRW